MRSTLPRGATEEGRGPAVMGDPVQLQQVLLNLVLGARDAVEDVPTERRNVTVHAQRRGVREVEVAISDSGRGIAPETLARLFESFFTLASQRA